MHGDANRDLSFDEDDIMQILTTSKYGTGEPAIWDEGDWNGDGVFDQKDIIVALSTGRYLSGPYAASGPEVFAVPEPSGFLLLIIALSSLVTIARIRIG